jgi:hypothetical protein
MLSRAEGPNLLELKLVVSTMKLLTLGRVHLLN